MSEPPDWTPPAPATDDELARMKLPRDVEVGALMFRAGVPLLELVKTMRSYQERLSIDLKAST